VILSIADQDIAVRHDGHTLESFELRVAGAPGTEGLQETAIRIEDLNAVIARIGHEYVALIVHGHTAVREIKNRSVTSILCQLKWVIRFAYRGNLNWPSSEPSPPTVERTLPFTSKICGYGYGKR